MAKQTSKPQPLIFLISLMTLSSSGTQGFGFSQGASLPDNIPQPNPRPMLVTVIPAATTPISAAPTNPAISPSVNNQVPGPPFVTVPVAVTPPALIPSGSIPVSTSPAPVIIPSPSTTSTSAVQTWCLAKTGMTASALQVALDYACGMGGADCSPIQPSGNCYNPNNPQSHASYAFNSYYHKNPVPSSCDFKGTAILVNVNPSTASCIYPSSSLSSASPPITTSTSLPPPATTPSTLSPPTTISTSSSPPPPAATVSPPATIVSVSTPPATPTPTPSSGLPPFVLNSSYPEPSTPSIYGASPPRGSNTSVSIAIGLRPAFAIMVLLPFMTTKKLCNA